MTCLKFLAQCPCPRCLIFKSRIPRLGMTSDMNDRTRLQRVDDEKIHRDIALVRRMIYVDGVNITSGSVDFFLKPKSLVPTRVYIYFIFSLSILIHYRAHSHCAFSSTDSIFIRCLYLTSCMSLNSASGRQSSPIVCEFFTRMGMKLYPF